MAIKHGSKVDKSFSASSMMQEVGSIDGVERTLRTRLDGQKEPTVSLHCDKTVAVDEVVKVMNVAKDNNYTLILATTPR